jgi:hypothetical protein
MSVIHLKDNEVNFLLDVVKKGPKNARELTRARILLLANQQKGVIEIAEILSISRNTTFNIRKKYVEEGLPNALFDKIKAFALLSVAAFSSSSVFCDYVLPAFEIHKCMQGQRIRLSPQKPA